MSRFQRAGEALAGLLMLLASIAMIVFPEQGYLLVVATLSVSFAAAGARALVYYARMARYMVGGIAALYRGIFLLDLGLFTASLADVPQYFVMAYLFGLHIFLGLVDMLRAYEAHGYHSPKWRISVGSGVINIAVAIACIVFIGSLEMAVYIYSAGLAYSAMIRIYTAFRRDAIIYIQ